MTMLLQLVFRTGVLLSASLATPLTTGRTAKSSCPAVSVCHCEGLSAHCRGNDTAYAQAVQSLPSNLETFVFAMFTTEKRVSLDVAMGGDLGRFWNLQVLQIQPYSREFEYDYEIKQVTASAFCNLTNLREVHLNAKLLHLKSDAVQCLEALETLDLSYTRAIRTDDLKAVLAATLSPHITKLLLRNTQRFNSPTSGIQEIDFAVLFSGLNRKNLRILDLAQNALTSLKPGLLTMPRLEKLDLSYNLLGVQHIWSHLSAQTLLEAISHPTLREFICMNQGFFPKNEQSLDWTKEKERRGEKHVEPRPNKTLMLYTKESRKTLPAPSSKQRANEPAFAPIRTFPDTECVVHLFAGKRLLIINVRGLLIEAHPYRSPVPSGKFCISPDNNVKDIDISNTQLNLFFDDPKFTNVTFVGFTKLEIFNARNNGLAAHYTSFVSGAFPSLQTLLLGGNRIGVGPHNREAGKFPNAVPPLQHLDLSRNGLDVVSRAEFIQFRNLQILDLSGNQFKDIDLQLPESLQLLNISGNRLTFLTKKITKYFDTFNNLTVDMTNNDYVCGCKVYHFIHWIQHTKTHLTARKNLYCLTETGQIRIMQVDLHTFYKECNPMTPAEMGAIGAAASIALCITVLLCVATYRKRWRIRYYFYRRRLRRQWAEMDDDYEYDAFVAHSDETPEVRNWVNVTMQLELEDKHGLKLFLPQRDLLGGGFVLERIDDAMRRCRKTVLVLSPDFLQSPICQYQAWSSYTSMVTDQRGAVVVVKLQALPIDGITGTLTSLLEIRECLTWTEDPEGQELFWNRVKDALLSPPNNPINS